MTESASNDLKRELERTNREADRLLAKFLSDMAVEISPAIETRVRKAVESDLQRLEEKIEKLVEALQKTLQETQRSAAEELKALLLHGLSDAVDTSKQEHDELRQLLGSASNDILSLGDRCVTLETRLPDEMQRVDARIQLLADAVEARKQEEENLRQDLSSANGDILSLGNSCATLETKLAEEISFSGDLKKDHLRRILDLTKGVAAFKSRSRVVQNGMREELDIANLGVRLLRRQCWALLVLSLVSSALAVGLHLSKCW